MSSSVSPLQSPPTSPAFLGRHLKLLVAGGAVALGITYLIVTALQTSTAAEPLRAW